jgi:hypothetical protein
MMMDFASFGPALLLAGAMMLAVADLVARHRLVNGATFGRQPVREDSHGRRR